MLLHEIFERTARAHGRKIAIDVPPGRGRSERVTVTYDAVWARAGDVARRLGGLVGSEALVATLLPRESPDLYACQLAALRAGGAFVCLDPRFPLEHMRSVVHDARPVAILCDATTVAAAAQAVADGTALIDLTELGLTELDLTELGLTDLDFSGDQNASDEPSRPRRPDLRAHDVDAEAGTDAPVRHGGERRLAYVIYTSGTTGHSKGVAIEHQAIANLVISDVEEFRLDPSDRVAQVSSPAYDSSLEEAWLAFAVGARLVLLDEETVRSGPDLVSWLRAERITVFCPPPTLLRAMACADPQSALPALKLLYVGGEELPRDLADLWAPGRRLVNGYGPTECTVTVVRGDVRASESVTIGRPVPNNQAWVLDEELAEVDRGEEGELCIGGIGLARGYLGRPEETDERFPHHPALGRIHRTGDLARQTVSGDFEYLGRIDDQVKLRGYRIELGAVEAAVAGQPGVRAAACRVQGAGRGRVLAAHVVPDDADKPPSPDTLRSALLEVLPEYMVPARWAITGRLPTSLGGKLDRRALPEIDALSRGPLPPDAAPATSLERIVAAAFAESLDIEDGIAVGDDFFVDLGGDSLAAAHAITALRKAVPGTDIAIRDLYDCRTVSAIAERLAMEASRSERAARSRARLLGHPKAHAAAAGGAEGRAPDARVLSGTLSAGASPHESRRHAALLVTAGQSVILAVALTILSAAGYFLLFVATPPLLVAVGLTRAVLLVPLFVFIAPLAYVPLAVLAAAGAKRALVGTYVSGRVPVWSGFGLRHWVVVLVARLIPWGQLHGTVFAGMALRALGATVGDRVHIHRGVEIGAGGWDLLSIESGAVLSQDAAPRTVLLHDGHLVTGTVTIGAGATIDVRAGLDPGAVVGAAAHVSPLSWVPGDEHVPAGSCWDGVPATTVVPADPAPAPASGRVLSPVPHGIVMIVAHSSLRALWSLPLVAVSLMSISGIDDVTQRSLAWLTAPSLTWSPYVAIAGLVVVAVPVTLLLQAAVLRAMGRVRDGVYDRYSLEAVRVSAKTATVSAAGHWLSGSMFWPLWLRLAGMRIGQRCEISTIIDVVPETVSIGDESFFADGIYFCSPRIRGDTITVAATTLGRSTFLGNHCVVPCGHAYPDDYFVGVATVADAAAARPGSSWFGHPPMELPRRAIVEVDRRLTHEPDALRIGTRLFWELLRLALPVLPLCLVFVWLRMTGALADHLGHFVFAAVGLPLASFVTIGASVLTVVALKWLLLGRVKTGQHPFWSCWCGRWDFLYLAWGFWARGALTALQGTLWLNGYLKLMGAPIGRRVVLGHNFAQVVDPDMLHFDNEATVACEFQAHSFEDRVLKIDHLRIGSRATVGPHTVVFYGADIGAEADVAPHGVVMKDDELPGGRAYAGHPVQARSPG